MKMTMRSLWTISFFTLALSLGMSAQVKISGISKTHSLANIQVFTPDDYFTEKRVFLQQTTLNTSGEFSIELPIKETTELILNIGNWEGVLYAEAGKNYELVFPEKPESQAINFDRTIIQLNITNQKSGDLNMLVSNFNADYDVFIRDHYFDFATDEYRGSQAYISKKSGEEKVDMFKKPEPKDSTAAIKVGPSFGGWVNDFEKRMTEKYSSGLSNPWFADYFRYTIAELKLLSGVPKVAIYREYFMSQPVLFRQPAYIKLVDTYYHQIITDQRREKQENIYKAVNVEKNFGALAQIFSKDSLMTHEVLRSVVLLKGLNEAYFVRDFNRPAVIATLQDAMANTADENIRKLAANHLWILQRCKTNWPLEDFTLLDADKDLWKLSAHEGKFTYLFFYAEWCSSCQKELQIMQKLHEQYGKNIQFVAIDMSEDNEELKTFLQSHRELKFEFLYGTGDPLLKQKCNVRALPAAILLDPDGKVVSDYTRKPSEGLNLEMEKINKRYQEGKNSGTWRN